MRRFIGGTMVAIGTLLAVIPWILWFLSQDTSVPVNTNGAIAATVIGLFTAGLGTFVGGFHKDR